MTMGVPTSSEIREPTVVQVIERFFIIAFRMPHSKKVTPNPVFERTPSGISLLRRLLRGRLSKQR